MFVVILVGTDSRVPLDIWGPFETETQAYGWGEQIFGAGEDYIVLPLHSPPEPE